MPGLSKVIVLDPDVRARRQLELGCGRDGIPTAVVAAGAPDLEIPGDDAGLVVVGGTGGQGVELIRRARGWLDEHRVDVPIVFAGRNVAWEDAAAAGADEAVRHPAYLRDIVTIVRLLRGLPSGRRDRLAGNLADVTSVFTLVRALAALGRSATLRLVRGFRRGEVRFYRGEVTSAQVGMHHGQAALHQLLLWTDARFEFQREDIVRRQQIPLSPDELFADAERFLESVRASSGGLSPAIVLEQDLARVQSFAGQIPAEVRGVLRLFDGHHVLADVLEDSAYRVFETLRVAQRAVDAGLLRTAADQPPRPRWRTVLPIEDWLVGGEPRAVAGASAPAAAPSKAPPGSGPAAAREAPGGQRQRGPQARTSGKRRKKKRRPAAPPPVAAAAPAPAPAAAPAAAPTPADIDWGALVPRTVGAEVGPLAGVVPASHVSGEIAAPASRTHDPSGDVAASGPSDRTGPAGVEAEPTVVLDEAAELARDAGDTDPTPAQRRDAEPRADAGAGPTGPEHPDAERAGAGAHAIQEAATESVSRELVRAPDDRPAAGTEPARRLDDGAHAQSTGAGADQPAAHTEPGPPTGTGAVEDAATADLSHAITARMAAAAVTEATPVPEAAEVAPPAEAPHASSRAPGGDDDAMLLEMIADEPSDGVVRQRISEPIPVRRAHLGDPIDDDRPGDITGEITLRVARRSVEIRHSEPSILISDLAMMAGEDAGAGEPPAEAEDASSSPERSIAEPGGRAPATAPARAGSHGDDKGHWRLGFWRRLRRKSSGPPRAPGGPDKK